MFENYDAQEMLYAVERAIGLFADYKDLWAGLINRAITTDFSWNKSGAVYLDFYKKITK